MTEQEHVDLMIMAEDLVKNAGWRVDNQHIASSGTYYFDARKLDENGDEVEDDKGEVIELSVRISTHSQQSICNGRLGGVDVNIFDKSGLRDLEEVLSE
jgi:hypothetical protein